MLQIRAICCWKANIICLICPYIKMKFRFPTSNWKGERGTPYSPIRWPLSAPDMANISCCYTAQHSFSSPVSPVSAFRTQIFEFRGWGMVSARPTSEQSIPLLSLLRAESTNNTPSPPLWFLPLCACLTMPGND